MGGQEGDRQVGTQVENYFVGIFILSSDVLVTSYEELSNQQTWRIFDEYKEMYYESSSTEYKEGKSMEDFINDFLKAANEYDGEIGEDFD